MVNFVPTRANKVYGVSNLVAAPLFVTSALEGGDSLLDRFTLTEVFGAH
jgi:hypothetical protein